MGAPLDVTLDELRIGLVYPADDDARRFLRGQLMRRCSWRCLQSALGARLLQGLVGAELGVPPGEE
jgi:hypothetical protein